MSWWQHVTKWRQRERAVRRPVRDTQRSLWDEAGVRKGHARVVRKTQSLKLSGFKDAGDSRKQGR